MTIIDLREDEIKDTKSENIRLKFESLSSLQANFKRLIVAYGKDEDVLRVVSKWYEDVNELIFASYLCVKHL